MTEEERVLLAVDKLSSMCGWSIGYKEGAVQVEVNGHAYFFQSDTKKSGLRKALLALHNALEAGHEHFHAAIEQQMKTWQKLN